MTKQLKTGYHKTQYGWVRVLYIGLCYARISFKGFKQIESGLICKTNLLNIIN